MLQHLVIENYALIQSLQISFNQGFTAITGETGAGKSIILGALGLLLGQRADTQVLSNKNSKCIVEATFDIHNLNLQKFFETNDIDYDDNLLIRREILPSAKSRAFVNDTPVQLQILKELGAHIIDIHSQHQTLTLTNTDFQLQLLDIIAGNTEILKAYQEEYKNYNLLKNNILQLQEESLQHKKEQDYNQFLFDELQSAQLIENEQTDLENELQLLNNTESIKQTFASILDSTDTQDDSTIARLKISKSQISKISSYHPDIEDLHNRIDSCIIELRDIVSEIESLDSKISYSPQRLEDISQRLDNIYRLQNKHNVSTITELLEIKEQLNEKLQAVFNLDQDIEKQKLLLSESKKKLQVLAEKLTLSRKKSAQTLEKQLRPTLCNLGMQNAQLVVDFKLTDNFLSNGKDNIIFLFNANKGGELREIGKVISGGELSRLMLAIKSLITKTNLLPTIIFDEIDTGVSGEISTKVATIMREMSQNTQVMAITHLPQIAAKANCHLKVFKKTDKNTTHTSIIQLSEQQRVEEIAKMLSSDTLTNSAIETARQIMN